MDGTLDGAVERARKPRLATLKPRSGSVALRAGDNGAGTGDEARPAVEGELVRNQQGLSEPGFSFIADHVEPLLLGILQNIHVAEKSAALAEEVRGTIDRGLNWYDFVAVLESLVTLIRQSIEQEREEFQGFLNQLNDNLSTVQSALLSSREQQQQNLAAERKVDETVRTHIGSIHRDVEACGDLEELKAAVSGQLSSIIGALDQRSSERSSSEAGLQQELRQLTLRVSSMEDESRALRQHLVLQQENALMDRLTELPNREAYDRRLRDACEQRRHAEQRGRRADDRDLCLAVCDVDHFKQVNDGFGHLAGDRVLKVLARELESRVRDTDFVARYGGEEFVIILPHTSLDDAAAVMEKLRGIIEHMPFHFKNSNVPLTASFGLAAWQPDDTPERLFERADKALYRAKQLGRNRCEVAR